MRIDTFTVKGVNCFAEPVQVDLRDVPPGIIGFRGANGSGKTTLLETVPGVLWREFPSRSERELLDYANSRDSYLEAVFSIDGQGQYRARVSLDGPKRNSDAVIEQTLPDGRPVLLTDGRVTTYDTFIQQHFPPKNIFLASCFAAQNRRGSLVTADKKTRREIFGSLLGLERYEVMARTARDAAQLCEQALVRLTALRDVLARDTSAAIGEELDRVALDLDQRRREDDTRAREVGQRIADLETRLAIMQDAVAAYAAATQRIKNLTAEQSSRQAERNAVDEQRRRAERDHAADVERIAQQLTADLKDLVIRRTQVDTTHTADQQQIARQLSADLKDIDERLAGNQKIQSQAADIRRAVETIAACDNALQQSQAYLDEKATDAEQFRNQIRHGERELTTLQQTAIKLERAKVDAGLLTTVPCGGAGAFAACQFLTNAQQAHEQIADLELALEGTSTLELALAAHRTHLEQCVSEANATRAHRARIEKTKAEHQPLAKYAEALAAAEARLQELTSRRAKCLEDAEHAQAAATARRDAARRDLDGRRPVLETAAAAARTAADDRLLRTTRELDDRRQAIDARLDILTLELSTATCDLDVLTDTHERAIALQVDLKDARASHDAIIRSLATIDAQHADLERRRADMAAKRARLTALERRLDRLRTEVIEWKRIAEATGREGLPTLEIDAAGPTVATYANDLMNVAFGPRFTLEIITEQPKRDGKGTKEVFSITAYDNARGGEARDVSDLSGGEQIVTDEAIKNALCIYLNLRSPMPIRTAWRDETTGPLDAENAVRYMLMLRRVRELAGFHHVLFVTHNPEAAAMADVQFYVADGKATMMLPPFSEAA